MKPANRINSIPPYIFAEIDKKKEAAIKQGVDLIDLSIGDPDLPTPDFIVKKMQQATAVNELQKYPPYTGPAVFKKAVASWYDKRFGVKLDTSSEVMALIGSKEGIA
ncbi:MAG: aminotransferase class I/II-fold pyridoxal phosphate-dependent enzyme, partial [bacterium]